MQLEDAIVSVLETVPGTLSAAGWTSSDSQMLRDHAVKLARFQSEAESAPDEETRDAYRQAAQEDIDLLAAMLCERANDAGRRLTKEICQVALQTGLQALLSVLL